MENLSFTPVTEAEAPIVAKVLTDAIRTKIKHGDTIWGNTDWTPEEVGKYMAESDIYLVYDDSELVGTVSMQWEDLRNWGEQTPAAGYLHRLAIAEGFNGKGYGSKILDWASNKVKQNGREFLRLDCPEDNKELCEYYEKLGFIKVGTRSIPGYGAPSVALYQRAA